MPLTPKSLSRLAVEFPNEKSPLELACGGTPCSEPDPVFAANAPRVRVTTSMGQFVIELNPGPRPSHGPNFLRYVREGQYTITLFHRVVGNFVIQGGGHAASDMHLKDRSRSHLQRIR